MANVNSSEQRKLVSARENSGMLNGTLILHYLFCFAVGQQEPGNFKGSANYVRSFRDVSELFVQVYIPLRCIRNKFLAQIPELTIDSRKWNEYDFDY